MPEWFSHIPRLELADPWWLSLLPLLALAVWFRERLRQGKSHAILFPDLERLQAAGFEARWLTRVLPRLLRWSVLVLCVCALAGPRLLFRQSEVEARGIDVVLAIDISESMLRRDFAGKSRLEAAREVARNFVLRRSNDRIGLVVFRGKAYTPCPLTLDHEALAMLVDHLSPSVIQDDGTAIGTAILVAVNRFKASESSRKVLILVTDGENNAGEVDPATAAELAARNGITIYAINAGFKVAEHRSDPGGESDSDPARAEEMLQVVARTTHGGYFRVEDPAGFEKIISTISRQAKSSHTGVVVEHRSGLFFALLRVALVLLLLEVVLSQTRLLRIP